MFWAVIAIEQVRAIDQARVSRHVDYVVFLQDNDRQKWENSRQEQMQVNM